MNSHTHLQLNKLNAPTWVDYIIVLLIIAGTGFEWCFRYNEMIFFWVFPLALCLFIKRRKKIDISVYFFFGLFTIWAFVQDIEHITALSASLNFGIRLFTYYIAFISIKNFPKVFVKIMLWICIIALIMYIICLIPIFRDWFRQLFSSISPISGFSKNEYRSNPGQTMILYFLPDQFGIKTYRNSGPFWEPGMFAVFINIALIIQLLRDRHITRETIVFLLASISTLSTTSLITTIFIFGFYYTFIHKSISSLFFIMIIGICMVLFLNSDYGLSKIQRDAADDATYSRFGAALYHLTLIQEHPLLGSGFNSYGSFKILLSPNGLTYPIVFWGIPFAIIYYILLFHGINNIAKQICINSNIEKVILIMVFLIVVFSQDATNRHFYLAIMMYGLSNPSKSIGNFISTRTFERILY